MDIDIAITMRKGVAPSFFYVSMQNNKGNSRKYEIYTERGMNDMKKMYVSPLKSVEDVPFGASRKDVRSAFGKFKEFKKDKDSNETADDFTYCRVYYDNGKMAAVEINIPACQVVIGMKLIDTTNVDLCKKSLDMEQFTDCNKSRSIFINTTGTKVKSITFGKPGYYDKDKEEKKNDPPNNSKPIKEDATISPGLGNVYDSIKASMSQSNPLVSPAPTGHALDAAIIRHGNSLKDNCFKHILLDMYVKVLPLDQDYISGHMGQMKSDISSMLKSKDMTATQYMTACKDATKAPLLEYVVRCVNNIASDYMRETKEEVTKAKEDGMDIPVPEPPEDPTENDEIKDQLVDIEDDVDYTTFIDTLKKKTIDKIVSDVTKIINDEKDSTNMEFNPKPIAELQETMESTTSIGMQYLQHKLILEQVDVTGMTEELLGCAIRESTLNQFDVCFKQPGSSFREFVGRIRDGKGSIINESAVSIFAESAKSADDVTKIVDEANEERDKKIDSKLKASEVINGNKEKDDGTKSPLK